MRHDVVQSFARGFGIAVVPYMDLLLKLDVKILPIRSPACERLLYLVTNDAVFQPPAVRLFRQFVLKNGTLPHSPEDR